MAGITIVADVSEEPISADNVRSYARIDDGVDTTEITNMIKSSRLFVENYLGRSLLNRTLKFSVDYIDEVDQPLFEGMRIGPDMTIRRRYLQLPRPPVVSVTHVKTFDDADTETTLSSSKYYLDNQREPARIILRNGETWPTALRVGNAIEVTYVSGYGTTRSSVPEAIIQGLFQHITFMYENRGDQMGASRATQVSIPPQIRYLLDPYKVLNFSTDPFNDSISGY